MGKKSKDKKSHKHKRNHSRKDSSHIEPNEQTRNEQSRSEQPRTKLRLSYRRDDSSGVTNSSTNNDDTEIQNVNGEYQDNDQIDVDNATVFASRLEEPPRRTILRLKFNPDSSVKKSKKRKHKHKRREVIDVASSHSHEKVDKGKRKIRDSIEESIHEENVSPDDNDSFRSHPRKKIKRQKDNYANIESANNKKLSNDAIVGTNDELDINLTSGINATTEKATILSKRKLKGVDSVNFSKIDIEKAVYIAGSNKVDEKLSAPNSANQEQKSDEGTNKPKEAVGEKPLEHVEAGPSITMQDRKEASVVTSTYQLREKRSYPPSFKDSNKSDDSRPSKVHKVSSKTVQSQENSSVIASYKSSETNMPLQVTANKDPDITENLNGKSIIKDVTIYPAPSSTKSGPVRKLGRPPKLQETQRTNTQRNWTWQKKKKDLKTILNKLLDSFEKKDAYGFFLEPVDTSIVTDYSTIISNPMDLGTMRRKVNNNEYTDIDTFKNDLALICNNCKTYNSPETLYYKSAEKLWTFGEKAIERERDSILLEEEKAKALKGFISVEDGKKATTNFVTNAVSSRGSSVSRPIRQPRRTRRGEPRKLFAPDGSVLPSGNPEVLLPKVRPFGETPLLTVISSKAQRPARFEDYGPFATLGVEAPYYSPSEKEYFYNIYGDERGYAYAQSIKNFVKDMGDEMNAQVDNFLNKLTRGTHNIDQCVAKMVSGVESVDTFAILDTELGPVDVRQELNRIQRLPELRRQRDELEMWQNEKIDLDSLVNDKEANSMLTVLENASFQEMLDLNAKSLAELISANENAVDLQGSQEQKQLVDDIQHRLFQLAQHAPKDEIKSGATPPMQSYVMPASMAGPQATKTLLPKHTMSGVEQNDPISALAPSLPEFPAISKSRTKPCNYNPAGKCANCQTTDTPGWRAGETPDQKLCNACGLYYAKNKSHRPSNLWATSSR
ncbi:unnamed protein product [Rhizophagus irregularis]|nr:unnamed protein product [Rhizophagus irregularis]CAB5357803.1 unnamed protein product [Rhizophagus irregularis]